MTGAPCPRPRRPGRCPGKTALIDGDLERQDHRQWTCAELLADAERAAGRCSIATAADSTDKRAQTLGRPLPPTEARIASLGTGATAGCGETGEICARYLVMREYLIDPAATAAAIDADGWLHTGDLGSMDERGYLRIAGRLKAS